jgi:hypothetical protein
VYQGQLHPAQYVRARIPTPVEQLSGLVTLSCTIAFATGVDPQDPGNYTRSGLDVVFRPDSQNVDPGSTLAKSEAFFQLKQYSEESELRIDAHKWETALLRSKRMQGSRLKDPVFDIHYNARAGGAPSNKPGRIRYAMIVSLDAPNSPQIYNQVVNRYRTLLVPLRPRIQIPLRVSA